MKQKLSFPRGQKSGQGILYSDATTLNPWIDNEGVLTAATRVDGGTLMNMWNTEAEAVILLLDMGQAAKRLPQSGTTWPTKGRFSSWIFSHVLFTT